MGSSPTSGSKNKAPWLLNHGAFVMSETLSILLSAVLQLFELFVRELLHDSAAGTQYHLVAQVRKHWNKTDVEVSAFLGKRCVDFMSAVRASHPAQRLYVLKFLSCSVYHHHVSAPPFTAIFALTASITSLNTSSDFALVRG